MPWVYQHMYRNNNYVVNIRLLPCVHDVQIDLRKIILNKLFSIKTINYDCG